MVPRIVAFRHEPNEPLGYFETIFNEHQIPFEYVDLFDTNEIPRLPNATHLIFLGGCMSVNDEEEFPWLIREKELIRRSPKAGQRVLGICLGAQLIASAYNAKVFRFVNETGWRMLYRKDDATGIFAQFPDQFPVFQIHNDSFEIPYGGRLLACGTEVKNQAFFCKNALGLQFHLEMTRKIILDWSRSLRKYPQFTIARDTPRFIEESNRLCRLVAEDFIR
ncbi:MAG: GMP synthase [Methanomicrobiales archaeon HGW-Methanomicrobiales-3]|jgi:GMP synthase-like glutamine amidotransferase|nr:MAG: GMP synthase [Methanomicrobiales archaeon HGW-Methanomicrobiales-3]